MLNGHRPIPALKWIPSIANVVGVRGVPGALEYPNDPKPVAPWADGADREHRTAVENRAMFASKKGITNGTSTGT